MYKLLKIDQFEITRNLIMKNLNDQEDITVFDDTDITGHDDFKFMQVGQDYECKIAILAKTKNHHQEYPYEIKHYDVLGYEKIANYNWLKVRDGHQNIFYVENNLSEASM